MNLEFFCHVRSVLQAYFHQDVFEVYGFDTWPETFDAATKDIGRSLSSAEARAILGELDILLQAPRGDESIGPALLTLCPDVDLADGSTPSAEVRALSDGIGGVVALRLARGDITDISNGGDGSPGDDPGRVDRTPGIDLEQLLEKALVHVRRGAGEREYSEARDLLGELVLRDHSQRAGADDAGGAEASGFALGSSGRSTASETLVSLRRALASSIATRVMASETG